MGDGGNLCALPAACLAAGLARNVDIKQFHFTTANFVTNSSFSSSPTKASELVKSTREGPIENVRGSNTFFAVRLLSSAARNTSLSNRLNGMSRAAAFSRSSFSRSSSMRTVVLIQASQHHLD